MTARDVETLPLTEANALDLWNALQRTSLDATVFSSGSYQLAVSEALSLQPILHVVKQADGRPTAGAVVLVRNRLGLRSAVPPPFTPVSAVLSSDAIPEAEIHSRNSPLDALAESMETYHEVRLSLPPGLGDVRAFQWSGWDVSPRYTCYVDLSSFRTAGLKDWSESAARKFTTARTEFEIAELEVEPLPMRSLLASSYGRHGRPSPLSVSRFDALVTGVASTGLARCFVARDADGDTQASVVLLIDETTAYYWMAGSVPGNAMTVLLGILFQRLSKEGLTRFDFVGANTPSIAEFKRRLGGKLVLYFSAAKCRSRILRTVRSIRNR